MRRPRLYLILIAALGLILAACASPSGSDGPGASSGGEPSTAAESEAPAESQDGGGGGGGGGGGLDVTLANGPWTGGEAQVSISGDASASFEAPLFAATSLTDGPTTTLTYTGEGGFIGIAIDAGTFSVSVTTPEVVGGGGTTTTCSVTYHSTADNNLSGDFSCPNSPAFTTTGAAGGTVDIEGSFTATR